MRLRLPRIARREFRSSHKMQTDDDGIHSIAHNRSVLCCVVNSRIGGARIGAHLRGFFTIHAEGLALAR